MSTSVMCIILLTVLLFLIIGTLGWRLNEHANKETTLDLVANDETKVLSKTPVKIPVRH